MAKQYVEKVKYWIGRFACFYLLTVRIWMGNIFIKSGLARLHDWTQGNSQTEIYLFTYEHPIPFLSPLIVALFALVFENLCSILIFIGFFTRLAVLPLIAMTVVIILTYDNNIQHYYWLFLLGALFFFGPGRISVDYFISRKL